VSNTFFQFKQFIVHQEHTAMKVCTDACLFGGWLAKDVNVLNASNILDIGTGTGLLSLMLAQANNNSTITALEIEAAAAKEAVSNVTLSPWLNNIKVIQNSLQSFCVKANQVHQDLFDVIVTNPPFFEGDLPSPKAEKNLAAHSTALPWNELIQNVAALLKPEGYYYVLLPALRAYTMQKLAATQQLDLVEEVIVYNKQNQLPFRCFQKYSKATTNNSPPINRSQLIIKLNDKEYSPQFVDLLKDYYLHL